MEILSTLVSPPFEFLRPVEYIRVSANRSSYRLLHLVLGKAESSPYPPTALLYSPQTNKDPNYLPWHGHMTTLTVIPSARRLRLATKLCEFLEQHCDAEDAWFVDLFMRAGNTVAQALYKRIGYSVYRSVV